MWYIIIILSIALLVWLFLKSNSNFFLQNRDTLADKRQLLIKVLEDFNIDTETDKIWLEAFDSFRDYPIRYKYDGRTILADKHTINGYDAPSGNHDYRCQLLRYKGFWIYLIGFIKANVEMGKDMRKLKNSWLESWGTVCLLMLSTPFWMLYVWIKGKTRKPKDFDHFSDGTFSL